MDFAVKENELGSPYMAFSGAARHRHFSLSNTFEAHQHQQQQTHRETHVCPSPYRHQGWKDETDPHQLVTFSREALNYDLWQMLVQMASYFSSIWFFPWYLELIPASSKSTVKIPFAVSPSWPRESRKKQEHYKNNVINVCSEECPQTSAELKI